MTDDSGTSPDGFGSTRGDGGDTTPTGDDGDTTPTGDDGETVTVAFEDGTVADLDRMDDDRETAVRSLLTAWLKRRE